MYVLVSGKTKECYCQVFLYTKGKLPICTPYCIGVGFEKAFFTAVSIYFPQALLTGCLFHSKQAECRKMEKLGIPGNKIKIATVRLKIIGKRFFKTQFQKLKLAVVISIAKSRYKMT